MGLGHLLALMTRSIDACIFNVQAIQASTPQIPAPVVSPPCTGNAGYDKRSTAIVVVMRQVSEGNPIVRATGAAARRDIASPAAKCSVG